jgi:hypothetical protein
MKHSRNGLEYHKIPVVEYTDLPDDIKERLKNYYAETDHREILNNSYIRYPYLYDFDDENTNLDKWFIEHIGDEFTEFVIIHFDW